MTSTTFELVITAEADVIRGCCGKSHEFGPCPFANLSKED